MYTIKFLDKSSINTIALPRASEVIAGAWPVLHRGLKSKA